MRRVSGSRGGDSEVKTSDNSEFKRVTVWMCKFCRGRLSRGAHNLTEYGQFCRRSGDKPVSTNVAQYCNSRRCKTDVLC
jgi:hypothetical protein